MLNTVRLTNLIKHLSNLSSDINAKIAELEQRELTTAKPHYSSGKYLYMLHPCSPGVKRKKTYVGVDPAKQRSALKPYKNFCELRFEQARLNNLIRLINLVENESLRFVELIHKEATGMKFDLHSYSTMEKPL